MDGGANSSTAPSPLLAAVEHALAFFLANNDVGIVSIALTAIINILKNIQSNPKDQKLRTLLKSNKNILYKITHPPGCRDLMSAIGWTSTNDAYVLLPQAPLNIINNVRMRIEAQLEAANALIAEIPRQTCHFPKEELDAAVPIVGSARFEVCVGSATGRRPSMEDEVVVVGMGPACNPNEDFFGVFDGHGGREAAIYAARNLYPKIGRNFALNPSEPLKSITTAFEETNAWMLQQRVESGTTAAISFIVDSTLYTANVGDTRCVLGWKDKKAVRLSFDHKPSVSSEKERIERLGGEVTKRFGISRVNGVLGVSRAFGDYRLYPFVSAVPHINILELNEDTMFLIIACDGFWDEFSDQEVVEMVFENALSYQNMGEYLSNMAIMRGSQDNVSVIVVFLNPRMALYEEDEEDDEEDEESSSDSEREPTVAQLPIVFEGSDSEDSEVGFDDIHTTPQKSSNALLQHTIVQKSSNALLQQGSRTKITGASQAQAASSSSNQISSLPHDTSKPKIFDTSSLARPSMRATIVEEDLDDEDSDSDDEGPSAGLGVGEVQAWVEEYDDSE